ncbi:MAG: pantetheine-phosphate adenylyltransferase [Nocardioidaceae bacterium]|nr:pantetheine-phosphate adenylyltransferase [Nocardioidaceae bacterium]
MRRAVCPGSFDPLTVGHLDVLARAAGLFDEVVVAVLVNESKSSLFNVEERLEMLRRGVADLPNVSVDSFEGLLVDFCRDHDVTAIVKGVRSAVDLGYEVQMAHMNERLAAVQTVLLPTAPDLSFVASSLVKEVARFGGDVSGLVPSFVLEPLRRRLEPPAQTALSHEDAT